MTRVTVGIHVHAEPARLRATLASLAAGTSRTVQTVLLPDGPDAATVAALAGLPELPQLGTSEPLGPPACFNRLAAASDADVLILLECGAQVGPGWLEYLLTALAADPRNGLVGPSTNLSWNEQCVGPGSGDTPAAVAQTAAAVALRYGAAARTLQPLYSLADFCYGVRREVLQVVGAADEAYGLGPCWEMDYNIRAARAGFRGVWACGAYVHRAPFTARRRREEARRFEASKRRYQDKFCALRLRGERADYERHCRGEACEHFAPRELIQVTLPWAPASLPAAARPAAEPALAPAPPCAVVARPALAAAERGQTPPLVSCIMPTRERPAFALQAVRYFQSQDYPHRELIVVDDGESGLAEQLPHDTRIRYCAVRPGLSIGAKRNRACELARGSIIAQWDDDDWYGPGRLSAQVAALRTGAADISALTADVIFDLDGWQFWSCTPDLHRRLFVHDVHGGTLAYARQVWEQLARYPDRSLAEDAYFLQQAVRRGARLCRVPGAGLFVYLRHGRNAWAFPCGRYLDPRGWQRVAEPPLPPVDRAFYASQAARRPPTTCTPSSAAPAAPLVSCIMPTADRPTFACRAVEYFLRQTYPARELIVVDDGRSPIGGLLPADERIQYIHLADRRSIGAKRNLACKAGRGTIVVHWDDDDWMADSRIEYQVQGLLSRQADICGLDQPLYYDLATDQSWQYCYPPSGRPWVAGNTLCYTREFWCGNPFPDLSYGEDSRFVWSSRDKRVVPLADPTFLVGLIHGGNACPKAVRQARWQPRVTEEIKRLMGRDWPFYASLARRMERDDARGDLPPVR